MRCRIRERQCTADARLEECVPSNEKMLAGHGEGGRGRRGGGRAGYSIELRVRPAAEEVGRQAAARRMEGVAARCGAGGEGADGWTGGNVVVRGVRSATKRPFFLVCTVLAAPNRISGGQGKLY